MSKRKKDKETGLVKKSVDSYGYYLCECGEPVVDTITHERLHNKKKEHLFYLKKIFDDADHSKIIIIWGET